MENAVRELDAALTDKEVASDFAEDHPDAPEWAVELADRIETSRARLKRAARAKEQRRQALRADLTRRVNNMAKQAGVPVPDETDVLPQTDSDGEASDLGKLFTPDDTEPQE